MRRLFYLVLIYSLSITAWAQHVFKSTSLSDALIQLDQSSKHYDVSFVYDELEDFTVTKTIKRGLSLPDAVREVCGFYPVRVSVKGHDILVECIQKDRTKLTGHLVGPDRQPIAYANITLRNLSDTTYIGGGVSNEAGDFVIPCGAERASVKISCVGFKTIVREMPITDAGTIRMQTENHYLDNVTVSGRMSVIRSESDRLLYIVSNDEFARGLSAQELLNRVPMVSVSSGHAVILGKGTARFMLNGRITEMGDEAIQQKLWTIRSEDIERIEVISIPSGRDMMEMGGGYINIVLRRDQSQGWRGNVSTEIDISHDWSGRTSGSVSYASELFDITVDSHSGIITQRMDNLTTYRTDSKGLNDLFSDTRAKQLDKEMTLNLTLRYQVVKHLELGGMLSWQGLRPDKRTLGDIYYESDPFARTEVKQSPDGHIGSLSLMAYCDWQLDKKGKLLSLTYHDYKKDDNFRTQVWSNHTYFRNLTYDNKKDYTCDASYHIQSARLDLTLPSPFLTLDAGLSYTGITNQALPKSQIQSGEIIAHSMENWFHNYEEKTKTAYINLHQDWQRLSFMAGLRYEIVSLDCNSVYEPGEVHKRIHSFQYPSRSYWLPSFSISLMPKESQRISLVWGTSCIRPNFYDLNPLYNYKTGCEITEGNPELRPSRVSRVELSYHNHQRLYACAYYHHVSDVLTKITTFEPDYRGVDGVMAYIEVLTTPMNYGRSDQMGLYLRYQHPLTTDLFATAEGEAYYYNQNKIFKPYSFYGWGKRLALSSDWYLNRRHTLLLNARYQHWFSDISDLTKTDGYGYFSFALRYSLMDDCLKLSLVANDPFRQHVTNETFYGLCRDIVRLDPDDWLGSFRQFIHTNHHTQYIGLSAAYSFGNKKVHRIRHDFKDPESERAQKR